MQGYILLLAMGGALVAVFGRRSVVARRVGASLIGLDVARRLIFFALDVLGGTLQTAARGQALGSLFWAAIELLLVIKFWKQPPPGSHS